jgi:hypothetical protein
MGRPRKSSVELRQSGAPANKISARIAEELGETAAAGENEARTRWLPRFEAAIQKELATFQERITPGETVLKDYGAIFNWRADHWLTQARVYAEEILKLPIGTTSLPIIRTECSEFLAYLKIGHERGFVMDPVACDNITLWFDALGPRGWVVRDLQLFDCVQAIGWKKLDGSRRYGPDFWESFTHRNVLAQGNKLWEIQIGETK